MVVDDLCTTYSLRRYVVVGCPVSEQFSFERYWNAGDCRQVQRLPAYLLMSVSSEFVVVTDNARQELPVIHARDVHRGSRQTDGR